MMDLLSAVPFPSFARELLVRGDTSSTVLRPSVVRELVVSGDTIFVREVLVCGEEYVEEKQDDY